MKTPASSDYAPLQIAGVAYNPASEAPFVLLKAKAPGKGFSIEIGPSEASSIILFLEGVHPPRPLTHDLLAAVVQLGSLKILGLWIYEERDGRFLSRLHFAKSWGRRGSLEVRPSDGLALSLRLNYPVFGHKSLLRSLNRPQDEALQALRSPEFRYEADAGIPTS